MENGWLVYRDWEDFAACDSLIETEELTREELNHARVRAYREFYFRPRFIIQTATKIRRPRDVKRVLKSAKSIVDRIAFFERANEKVKSSLKRRIRLSASTGSH